MLQPVSQVLHPDFEELNVLNNWRSVKKIAAAIIIYVKISCTITPIFYLYNSLFLVNHVIS